MSRRRGRWLAPLLVLALGNFPGRGEEPGLVSLAGTVRLASGRTADYSWSYFKGDRNALAGALPAGDAIVVLTDSGALLRFDRATLKLNAESSGAVPATCLGRGDDGVVLAGYADGRIGRIDPAGLAMTELGRVPGKVQWVGTMPAAAGRPARPRLVAVAEQRRPVIHDLGEGKSYTVDPRGKNPARATAFLLDRKHRLWLGADNGEWGGWCSYVDLDAGEVHSVPGRTIYGPGSDPAWQGVFGFAELRDGQVWAHGGLTHMGDIEAFVWRVDTGKAEELYRLDNGPLVRREIERAAKGAGDAEPAAKAAPGPDPPFPTDRPFLPITHVVEDPKTGAIVVVAFGEIYRTDARLARWKKIHELKIGYRWGRRDAMGAYPSVRSMVLDDEPGRPMGLLFATRLDGLIRLVDGKETRHTPLAPLDVESVRRIATSSEGVLLFAASDEDRDEDDVWRFHDGTWSPASFAPPYQPHPDAPGAKEEPPDADWVDTRVLAGRGGSIVTVSASFAFDDGGSTRTTARWRDGKAEILGREVSTLIPAASFATPDGQLWNAENSILRRFVGGRWVDVEEVTDPRGVRRADWNGLALRLTTVNLDGPPWWLHDRRNHHLLRLAYGPGFKDPRLEIVPLNDAGRSPKVRDAIAWAKAELLLATDSGLRTFAIDGGKLAVPPLDAGGRTVSRLARDGRGRLWLGGQGLAVLDPDGKTLYPLDELPMLGRSKVEALAADTAHSDGAIAAIEGRGVVFVRVEAR